MQGLHISAWQLLQGRLSFWPCSSCSLSVCHSAISMCSTILTVSTLMWWSYTKIYSAFGLTVIISTARVYSIFILLSRVLIIRSVLSMATPEKRKKAFTSRTSHITAVAIFSTPLFSLPFVLKPHPLYPLSLWMCIWSSSLWWTLSSTVWKQSRFRELFSDAYIAKDLVFCNHYSHKNLFQEEKQLSSIKCKNKI